MESTNNTIIWLIQAGGEIYARKRQFLALFVVVFFGSVFVLARLDLLPEIQRVSVASEVILAAGPTFAEGADALGRTVAEVPLKIEIATVGLVANVLNPTATDAATLDNELLKGAVRYPTSAKLGENGNIVIFGHSSYLPVVNNRAYKAFNGIQKLSVGDIVTVYSSRTAYTYSVRSVAEKKADDDTAIPLSVTGKVLTLVTCDSFGAKEDRFVVTADFVESHLISS